MNKKHRTFVCLMAIAMVMMILLPSCYGIAIECKEKKLEIGNSIDNNIVVVDGSIVADVDNDTLRSVRPSINLTNGQSIDFNASKTGSGKYFINKTLRINIDVINDTNSSTLLGRYITTCIILLRKNRSSLDGLLRNLFIGKILNINRTNVLSEGEKYIEIPLMYETSVKSEHVVMRVLAVGTMLNIACGKIDLEFVYSSDSLLDTTPPVTICILDGEQIEENVYTDKVIVSLEAHDEESKIKQTMQRFDYSNPDGVNASPWEEYDKPLVFSNKGEYNIHYYSIDTAENIEMEKTCSFHIF